MYMKEKIYIDKIAHPEAVSYFFTAYEPVWAGTTIYSMAVNEKCREYQELADLFDICFLFDDDVPIADFYSVPWIDIFAKDSHGGYFAGFQGTVGLDEAVPVLYIDSGKNIYRIADNLKDFLDSPTWCMEKKMVTDEVKIFKSKEEAQRLLLFMEPNDMVQAEEGEPEEGDGYMYIDC